MAILLGLLVVFVVAVFGGLYSMRGRTKLFIKGLTDEQKAALTAADVPHESRSLEAGGAEGTLIRRQHIGRACKTLRVYVLTTWKTKRPGIEEAVLRPKREDLGDYKPVSIFFASARGRHATVSKSVRRPAEALIRETIVPKVGCSVIVHMMHGAVAQPIDDNRFHIFVQSSANNARELAVPNSVLGFRSGAARTGVRTTAVGTALIDQQTNYMFGDIVGANCLFLHHNALASGGPRLAQLAAILDFAVERLNVETGLTDVLAEIGETGTPNTVRLISAEVTESRRKQVLESLTAATLGRSTLLPIVITDAGGAKIDPVEDGTFRVFYNGRPQGLAPHATLPTGNGIPISGRTADIAAELIGNNLFVLSDILRFGLKPQVEELAEILCSARDEMAEGELAMLQRTEKFAINCARVITDIAVATAPSPDAVTVAEQQLTRLMTTARETERTLVQTDMTAETELGREFDSILAVRKVRDVRVSDAEMIVDTDMIYCTDPRTNYEHEIGRFRFHLYFNGEVRFWNTTHQIRGYGSSIMNAPHVNAEGKPCLGNIRDLMPQLIYDRQFASAVQIAIAFLESVNVNDAWGRGINNWPVHNHGRR